MYARTVNRGSTLIELIVSIIIIGALATIVVVSYNNWQQSLVTAQIKSDLNGAASAMENARSFNNAYPTDVTGLTTFSPSDEITLSGGSTDSGVTFCIDAISSSNTSLHYYIDSTIKLAGAQLGTCALPAIPSNLVASTIDSSSINVSWDSVIGAISYTLQRDTTPSFLSPTTTTTQSLTNVVSSSLAATTAYYYRVKATVAGGSGNWSEVVYATTSTVDTPSAPTITVTLNTSNVLATITPVTCTNSAIAQYGIRSRTNNSSWGSYSEWSNDLVSFQTASQGVKYGYQAQARCYLSNIAYSNTSTGSESTYIHPITAPVAPTVTATTVTVTTTWSWPSATCAAGTTVRYQYRYTISPSGSDSGWTTPTDPFALSISFTTSTVGQKYTVQIQAQCSNSYATSAWGEAGQAGVARLITLIVAGGGAGGNEFNAWTGGGGGAGGLIYDASYSISSGANSVTVGLGGNTSPTTSGGNSIFGTLTAIGGGRGAAWNLVNLVGGSGGGGSSQYNWPSVAGTPGQGYPGGSGYGAEYHMCAGGGGGAGGTGYDAGGRPPAGKPGGPGLDYSSVFGTSVGVNGWFAGGGGGGADGDAGMGIGGTGGGGNGAVEGTAPGSPGVANTGGGGGGGGGQYWVQNAVLGGAGGSGIVLVAYPTSSLTATGGTTYTYGSNTIHKFTSSGTFTVQ